MTSDRHRDADDAGICLTAEISADAVRGNLAALRSLLPSRTQLFPAVKADAYGHGMDLLVGAIAESSDGMAVATGGEALRVRGLGYTGPVLMLFSPGAHGGQAGGGLENLLAADVMLTVVCSADVSAVAAAADRAGTTAHVHVMIDTGMNRSGVPDSLAAKLVREIRAERHLHLSGLYTHFAAADEADKASARQQFARFEAVAAACGGRDELTLHAANSSAIIDLPETHLDLVRPGISVYGYQPSDEMQNHAALQPALRLSGPLMQMKDVPAGSRCGYGLTHTFERASRIGLVPVGYGDGYMRCLSNRATMRVAGCDVPVVGRVSMDQTIVDLTDAPGAALGDEIEIISPDASAPHSVEALARLAGTIPHEITTRLGGRIRRIPISQHP